MLRIILFLSIVLVISSSCTQDEERGYFENGQISYQVPIVHGKRQGNMITFYSEGQIKGIANYTDGKLDGQATGYDSIGNEISIIPYSHGIKHGKYYYFYPSGKVKKEGSFKLGKHTGPGFEYFEDGRLLRKYFSDNGDIIYVKTYSQDGNLIASYLPIEITKVDGKEKINIKLSYSEYDSTKIGIIFGGIDSLGKLTDTLKIVESTSLEYEYPIHDHIDKVTGTLYEIKMPESTIQGQYHFEYIINAL